MILPFNPHGTYHVGVNTYLNKTEAAYQASIQRKPMSWDFHTGVYSKFDWTQRPPGTIKEHYRARAQQIRDSYDHVVIPFSGGMDSYTVLHSFLSNNIHVDEIWTNWPLKQIKYQPINTTDRDEMNILSEYKYAVLPVLDYVRKNFPRTNIVVNDYSKEYHNEFTESQVKLATTWQSPSSHHRGQGRSDLCDSVLKQNKRVARVYGFDKIKLRVTNHQLYAFFTDHFGSGEITTGEVAEFFYHSPNAPLIPILQAHCLKDALTSRALVELDPNSYIDGLWAIGERGLLNVLYMEVCYPDFPKNTFQTGKPMGTLIRKSDLWLKDYSPRFYDSWKWVYDQYFNSLDDSLLQKVDNTVVGLHYYASGNYLVADNFKCREFDFTPNVIRSA